jgi:acetyl-CoA acetyltransferase
MTAASPPPGAPAIVSTGQKPLSKRGTSPDPEMKLCLRAIVAACEDAGISPADVDGFVSYGSERHEGQKLMPALGTKELRFGALIWGHGGGIPGALGLAATAIVSGQAEVVAVYRSLAENSGARLRVAVAQDDTAAQYLVNGLDGPVQICALRSQRMLEADGVPSSTMFAMARAAYHHAQRNPDAVAYGKPFDETVYEQSRFVSEPYRLHDCSRENDGGVAVILTSAARAAEVRMTARGAAGLSPLGPDRGGRRVGAARGEPPAVLVERLRGRRPAAVGRIRVRPVRRRRRPDLRERHRDGRRGHPRPRVLHR